MIYIGHYDSPLGTILLAARKEALVGLWLEKQKYFPIESEGKCIAKEDYPVLVQTMSWLERYFAGQKPEIDELKLAPQGSEFRRIVWQLLCEIPYGQVTTYGEIAAKIAAISGSKKVAAQAVGGAVGHNMVSIIIPCHRVIGANGNLTGYAGGIEKKIWLLKHEGVNLEKLFVPKKGTAL